MDYEIMIRFLLAALWGGMVGIEREYRSKSAGFRTMIMISVGACFFTMMSMYIGAPGNPDRIASNIVTGIGFLGAGVIFRGNNRVNGITTSATIWTVAAVGMGIGAGRYFAAACASILILIVLAILPYIESFIDTLNQSKTYSVKYQLGEDLTQHIEDLLKRYQLKYKLSSQVKDENELSVTWQVQGHSRKHRLFIADVLNISAIKRFEY